MAARDEPGRSEIVMLVTALAMTEKRGVGNGINYIMFINRLER